MKKQKNSFIIKLMIPAFVGVFFISGCSNQSQNDPALGSTTNGSKSNTTNANKDGAISGTIKGGSASSANQTAAGNDRAGQGGKGHAGGNNSHGSYATGKGDGDITPAGLNDPNNLLSNRIIYFDYNKSSIRPEYMVILNTHAKLLAKYPNLRARLEGHADERGSREYNVALSEDRARSVKRLMGIKGARGAQMTILGYGEELPVVTGHDKRSWQKNRRVEIKYKNY